MAPLDGARPLFIISDGTGDTATQVVEACLVQFEDPNVQVHVFPLVTDHDQLRHIMADAKKQKAMVVCTLVRASQRTEADKLAKQFRVQMVDVIGNMLGGLSAFLRKRPQGTPGLLHMTSDDYFRRVEALEFTVKADDGKEPRMLLEADIVLVGVSRTSKTPLSVFLSHKGFKVANVPLVLERDPPPDLWNVDPQRIFGLTIDPAPLQTIRKDRLLTMRMPGRTNYGQLDYILAELDFAQDLFSRNRDWPIINVTGKAVEETSATIVRILDERGLIYEDPGEMGQL
jgi:regulator of PEP synthase PpsR (kinase-PPPase family)